MGRDIARFIKPELALEFQKRCKEDLGIDIRFSSVDRDYKEQAAYFAQGREDLLTVNTLRLAAGLAPINSNENCMKVTWTLSSKHVVNLDDENTYNDLSYAFDFYIYDGTSASWDVKADVDADGIPDYLECALVGESLGLVSGMRFKNKDFPHMEYKGD